MSHKALLALGLIVLIAADLVLATMVADTAPADLRGTAYGFFNLVSGLVMLVASVLAGLLWDRLGASFTFYAGAVFCAIGLVGLAWQPVIRFHKA